VRGDQTIDYGSVMRLMGMIHSAGYSQVALIVELPEFVPDGETEVETTTDPESEN
jgi:hypothetical protein